MDIWRHFFQIWGGCNAGPLFRYGNPQQFVHMLHIFFYFQVYCCRVEFFSVTSTLPSTPWYSLTISLVNDFIQTGLIFGFLTICLYSKVTPMSSPMIELAILVRYSCCVNGWLFLVTFYWIQLDIKCVVSFTWLCILWIHFWCCELYDGVPPCIGPASILGGV